MDTPKPPDRESQSREVAGLLHLCKELVVELTKVAPGHELVNKETRYAVYQEGYSGKTSIDYSVAMQFEGELRDLFFKGSV